MPGPRSAVVTGLLVLASLCAAPPAHAAAPSNDDFDAATVITSLPYSDTTSTVEATRAPHDPACADDDTGGTIWYAFTPSADGRIQVDTAGSAFDTQLITGTGTQDEFFVGECADDGETLTLDVSAGTTYYFMAGGLSGATGTLVFNVQQAPPPLTSIAVAVDARDTITHDGRVTVRGTVVCDRPADGTLRMSAVQSHHHFTASSNAYSPIACGPAVTPWSVTFASSGVAFLPGKLSLTYDASAFDSTDGGLASTSGALTVALNSAH
jgi:hypothetical protein